MPHTVTLCYNNIIYDKLRVRILHDRQPNQNIIKTIC